MGKLAIALFFVLTISSFVASFDPLREQFNDFVEQYKKVYTSDEEYEYRFGVFKDNLVRIAELQKRSTSAKYGVTKFSGMTKEEFSKYPCGGNLLGRFDVPRANPHWENIEMLDEKHLPVSFDWTTVHPPVVTAVKDQGNCGSCWAFSSIANIEGVWALAGHKLVNLSESELVDCTTTSYGCGGGWPYWADSDLLKSFEGKVDTLESYPYIDVQGACKFNKSVVGATIKSYINYCNEETKPCTINQMMNLLFKNGPLSVCLNAETMASYKSGVDNPTNATCTPLYIDHCITLVGWGVDTDSKLPYWKFKNSWGTDWGEDGYFRIIRSPKNPDPCGIQRVITSAFLHSNNTIF